VTRGERSALPAGLVAVAGLLAALALPHCGASSGAGAVRANASEAAGVPPPKFSAGPWAAALAAACTPSGPVQCFNATDDNCNGVIDEGCGVCTGPLQFTIAWSEANANVDLVVIDPNGSKVTRATNGAGLRLDRDCPKDGCGGQNVDNVCLDGADPVRGRYVLEIHLTPKAGAVTPPTKVRVGVRVGDRSYGADLELSPLKDQEAIGFAL
jgi:tRNA (guanosine-2'-O-)-methyltransferase